MRVKRERFTLAGPTAHGIETSVQQFSAMHAAVIRATRDFGYTYSLKGRFAAA